MTAKEAFNALLNLLNAKPWFEKEAHVIGHRALDMLSQYLQQQIQKEGEKQDAEHKFSECR